MEINYEQLKKVGAKLARKKQDYINDRQLDDLQKLKNYRQYKGVYDPEVEKNIPDERSKAYPRDTRKKVKGGVAKLMEMMFPAQEKNWGLSTSPVPSIPKDALESILQTLTIQGQETGNPVTSDDIERAVRAFATGRKEKMEQEIADQLSDPGVDYPQLCKKVVRSGYIYGYGVARSPMVRTQRERIWKFNQETGQHEAIVKNLKRPYPEFVRIWDFYPDLSAKTWEDQELVFERFVFSSRNAFRKLGNRPDFKKEVIKEYLKEHSSGNYTQQSFETELHSLNRLSNISDMNSRRYEIYRALGYISAHDLRAAGVDISDDELDQDIFADIWFIDDYIIKADKAAFGDKPSDHYHAFVYSEDEDAGITGVGLPEEIRDSQMSICASTRAMLDNMAATAGPIFEVNVDLLSRGRKTVGPIHAFQTIEREGEGIEAQYPAIRPIQVDSHVSELLSIRQDQRQQLDAESNLPDILFGGMQEQPGEAFRTSGNMSMMIGGANMVTKDVVRAFDKFTSSLIGSLLAWNMEFNPNEELKGDYQVLAKGNISLVAKEVRGAALDQFMATLSQEERAILDIYGLLIDRLKSRDLPVDRVLPKEEAMATLQSMKDSSSQAAQIEQQATQAKIDNTTADSEKKRADAQAKIATTEAVVQELLSRVEKNMASVQSEGERIQLENLKTLLSATPNPGGMNGGQR